MKWTGSKVFCLATRHIYKNHHKEYLNVIFSEKRNRKTTKKQIKGREVESIPHLQAVPRPVILGQGQGHMSHLGHRYRGQDLQRKDHREINRIKIGEGMTCHRREDRDKIKVQGIKMKTMFHLNISAFSKKMKEFRSWRAVLKMTIHKKIMFR